MELRLAKAIVEHVEDTSLVENYIPPAGDEDDETTAVASTYGDAIENAKFAVDTIGVDTGLDEDHLLKLMGDVTTVRSAESGGYKFY